MIFSLVMIPLCLMCFVLYTYHREEKYGLDQLFKETYKKGYTEIETSKYGGNASKAVV